MLKNAALVVKIGVDTAKNEPRKGSKKTYVLKDPVGDTPRRVPAAEARGPLAAGAGAHSLRRPDKPADRRLSPGPRGRCNPSALPRRIATD